MRKLLTGTTALVGVGALAAGGAQAQEEGIKIGLSGFMNNYFAVLSVDEVDGTDRNETQHFQDATINFIGSTTLDNGVEVGVRFELESFDHPGDEQFAWFSGNFGEIDLGSTNSAGYRLHLTGPHFTTGGVPINTGWVTIFVPPPAGQNANFRTVATGTFIDLHNDSQTVSYFSPRVAGFQFGASFTPDSGGEGAVGQATSSTGNPDDPFSVVDQDVEFHNAWSVGANYIQTFNGVEIGISGAFQQNSEPDDLLVNGSTIDDGRTQYLAGGYVSFGGFTIGGSWAREDSDTASEGHAFAGAAAYSTGPWTVSVEGLRTEVEGVSDKPGHGLGASTSTAAGAISTADGGNDELTSISGGIGYTLGPGISIQADVLWAEWDEENLGEQDGIAGVLGTTVTF